MDPIVLAEYQAQFSRPRTQRPGELFCITQFAEVDGSLDASNAAPSVGPFSVVKELGSGGFACTVLAIDEASAERVAIKIPLPGELQKRDCVQIFHSEQDAAKAIGRKNTQNLVEFRFAGLATSSVGKSIPFIVMEYIAGRTLKEKLAQWPNGLPQIDAVRIGIDVCNALEVIHAQGYTHRDLKPANVILDSLLGERAVVADFGIATNLTEFLKQTVNPGTWTYAAPQRIKTQGNDAAIEVNPIVDLFSLGCVLFELVTGAAAFTVHRDSNGQRDIRRLVADMEDAKAIRSRLHAIHPSLRDIILKLLRSEPDEWSTVLEKDIAGHVRDELTRLPFKELNSGQASVWESPSVSASALQSIRDLAAKGYSIPAPWVGGVAGILLGLVNRKRISQEIHDIVHQTTNTLMTWMSTSGEGGTTDQREFEQSINDISGLLEEKRRRVEIYRDELEDPMQRFKQIVVNVIRQVESLSTDMKHITRTHSKDMNRLRDQFGTCQ